MPWRMEPFSVPKLSERHRTTPDKATSPISLSLFSRPLLMLFPQPEHRSPLNPASFQKPSLPTLGWVGFHSPPPHLSSLGPHSLSPLPQSAPLLHPNFQPPVRRLVQICFLGPRPGLAPNKSPPGPATALPRPSSALAWHTPGHRGIGWGGVESAMWHRGRIESQGRGMDRKEQGSHRVLQGLGRSGFRSSLAIV